MLNSLKMFDQFIDGKEYIAIRIDPYNQVVKFITEDVAGWQDGNFEEFRKHYLSMVSERVLNVVCQFQSDWVRLTELGIENAIGNVAKIKLKQNGNYTDVYLNVPELSEYRGVVSIKENVCAL